ncbi:hypothetical protein [Kineosporia succinea]|uniref:Secreted protein n=1 Tax=Kineosporia succinea TaxID=84632 RepID=A0ABT9PE49_9ACTN|nr:hypothetical protein [Kineosporia succinea]MDP9830980.1 hypothetical protein [Kineosporia succinea]
MTRIKKKAVAAAVGVLATAGLLVSAGPPAQAATNTVLFCVQNVSSGYLIFPSRYNWTTPVIPRGHCWSAYLDTGGLAEAILVYRDNVYSYATAWNSNVSAKAIYI